MIGNDIIDLHVALPQKKYLNFRYREKIFHDSEERLIENSKNPELTLWRLWSMKESAYKAHQRNFNLSRALNPKSFYCRLENDFKGTVKTANSLYQIQSKITDEYIYSFVSPNNNESITRLYRQIDDYKERFLKDVSDEFNLNLCNAKLTKDSHGIPSITIKNKSIKIPVSLSHHGIFSAFIFPLIKS